MKLAEMTWPEVKGVAESAVAILPLGATEQHGPHLAVSTDLVIVSEVSRRVEERLKETVVVCPALPFGASDHHLAFGATISFSPELMTKVVAATVTSLVRSGFRRIVLLNGHGGNITPARQALAQLGNEGCPAQVALATYWEVTGKPFAGAPPMQSPALSHACEYETSLMLHIAPAYVHMERAERASRPASNGYVPWEDDEPYRGVTLAVPTQMLSSNGSSGEPQLATAEKGAVLLEAAVASVSEFVRSFATWPMLEDRRHYA